MITSALPPNWIRFYGVNGGTAYVEKKFIPASLNEFKFSDGVLYNLDGSEFAKTDEEYIQNEDGSYVEVATLPSNSTVYASYVYADDKYVVKGLYTYKPR